MVLFNCLSIRPFFILEKTALLIYCHANGAVMRQNQLWMVHKWMGIRLWWSTEKKICKRERKRKLDNIQKYHFLISDHLNFSFNFNYSNKYFRKYSNLLDCKILMNWWNFIQSIKPLLKNSIKDIDAI